MRKDEFEAKELVSKELKEQQQLKYLTLINTVLIIIFGVFSILASQQAETKVDYRYFLTTRSLEQIEKVYINTYNGNVYKSKEDYESSISKNPKYKKRNIIQKWFKSLSKGS